MARRRWAVALCGVAGAGCGTSGGSTAPGYPTIEVPTETAAVVAAREPTTPPPLPDGGQVVHRLEGQVGVWLGIPDGEHFQGNYDQGLGDVWGTGRLLLAVDGDHVLRSIDGGASWTSHGLGQRVGGNRLWGPSETEIYLAHGRGVSRSGDSGLTWELLDTGMETYAMSVWGSGPDDVWAVGGDRQVVRSTTRGRTWTRRDVDGATRLRDVWGRSATDVWVAGSGPSQNGLDDDAGRLWRTRDGGTTWTPTASPPCQSVHRLAGAKDGSVYVGCQDGKVAKSTDDGASWTERGGTGGIELLDLDVLGPGRLVLLGRNQTFWRSTDDGRTWTPSSPLGDDLSELRGFFRDGRGTEFIVGLGTSGSGGWLIRRTSRADP